MAYQANLKGEQTITLENQGDQTIICVSSDGQRQGSSVKTGGWTIAPTLFESSSGAVVEIHTGEGSIYFQVEDGQLHSLHEAPDVRDAQHLNLEIVAAGTEQSEMKPMAKMAPLKPMKPM